MYIVLEQSSLMLPKALSCLQCSKNCIKLWKIVQPPFQSKAASLAVHAQLTQASLDAPFPKQRMQQKVTLCFVTTAMQHAMQRAVFLLQLSAQYRHVASMNKYHIKYPSSLSSVLVISTLVWSYPSQSASHYEEKAWL